MSEDRSMSAGGMAILLLFGTIFMVRATEALLVWNGVRHAKALCADPGPLIIHDRKAWDAYSKDLHSRLTNNDDINWEVEKAVKRKHGITDGMELVKSINPLNITFKHVKRKLIKNNKIIAELNHYGADDISPIYKTIFFGEPYRKYDCVDIIRAEKKDEDLYLEF